MLVGVHFRRLLLQSRARVLANTTVTQVNYNKYNMRACRTVIGVLVSKPPSAGCLP